MKIDPEILEGAEYKDYYSSKTSVPDGLELSRRAENKLPNMYKIVNKYPDEFEITEDCILKPRRQVIDFIEVSNGLRDNRRNPANEKSYDAEIEIEVLGKLQLNKESSEAIGGGLEVFINIYPD